MVWISLDSSAKYVGRMREIIKSHEEITSVISQLGRPDDGTDVSGFHNLELFAPLKPRDEWRSGVTKNIILVVDEGLAHLVVAVAGARGAGKSSLIAALERARGGDLTLIKARLGAAGLDETLLERLQTAQQELGLWFQPGELVGWGRDLDRWVFE